MLALIPVREGIPLFPSGQRKLPEEIRTQHISPARYHQQRIIHTLPFIDLVSQSVFGRIELLTSLYSACKICSLKNPRSSKAKCQECSVASSWKQFMPKQWIRVLANNNGTSATIQIYDKASPVHELIRANGVPISPITGATTLYLGEEFEILPPSLKDDSPTSSLKYILANIHIDHDNIIHYRIRKTDSSTIHHVNSNVAENIEKSQRISTGKVAKFNLSSPSSPLSDLSLSSTPPRHDSSRLSSAYTEAEDLFLRTNTTNDSAGTPLFNTQPLSEPGQENAGPTSPKGDETQHESINPTTNVESEPLPERAPRRSVYILRYGQFLSKEVAVSLALELRERQFTVYEKLNSVPDYIVIDEHLQNQTGDRAERVAKKLGFAGEQDLRTYLCENHTTCVKLGWIRQSHVQPDTNLPTDGKIMWLLGSKRRDQSVHASSTRPVKKLQRSISTKHNEALSETLKEVSKLYSECPIEPTDHWRSYMFKLVSGRVTRIGFEIVNDPEVLSRVRQIDGIGRSVIEVINDFVSGSSIRRIEVIKNDPERMAVKCMMNIWGVGWKTALSLVREDGYMSIEQLRRDVDSGKKTLERNQYIGLLCYHDIMDRMERSEVEAIAHLIAAKVLAQMPGTHVDIMGSYRRGKLTCGDVDILLYHENHVDSVPPYFLGEIVDKLSLEGVIAYHLTMISGMKKENFETLTPEDGTKITNPNFLGNRPEKKDKIGKSSYMGIVRSPITGRMRRIDIKFYPWRLRIYASLYFTGNGFFNRSMRWWSRQRMGYSLSDDGLTNTSTGTSVLEPTCEKDVFDILKLVWKEPHDRDSFDAVQGTEIFDDSAADTHEITNVKAFVIEDAELHPFID